jgi:hypothetical protein
MNLPLASFSGGFSGGAEEWDVPVLEVSVHADEVYEEMEDPSRSEEDGAVEGGGCARWVLLRAAKRIGSSLRGSNSWR